MISVSKERLTTLLQLSREQENLRAEYCKTFIKTYFKAHGLQEPNYTNLTDYLKFFVYYFYNEDLTYMRDFDFAITNKRRDEIFDNLLRDKTTQYIAQDIALQELAYDFHKNVQNRNFSYARGNLSEAMRYIGMKNVLSNFTVNGQKIDIKATYSGQFKEHAKYDILISLPPLLTESGNKFSAQIPIENKTSLLNFHFGTISANAIGSGKDKAYNDFLLQIQDIYNEYTQGLTTPRDIIKEIRKSKDDLLGSLAEEYIWWKLNDNFPVFVSHKRTTEIDEKKWYELQLSKIEGKCLLCSEVIQGFLQGKGTIDKKETGIGEKLYEYLIGFQEKEVSYTQDTVNKYRYIQQSKLGEITKDSFGLPEIKTIGHKEARANLFLDSSRRIAWSSNFKISLWYGKPQ